MITIREFRERRTTGTMTQSLLELTFRQLFEQWHELQGKLTNAEAAAYSNEARIYRDLVGLTRAIEIMEEVNNEYK